MNPFKWFLSSTKILELEQKYNSLLFDVRRLEEENIETTNTLYELMNSIDAVEARIDILASESYNLNETSQEQ